MKISVIIPSYNHAQYLERAVMSVYAQTYQEFQLIVIDDGSSDLSVQVLESLRDRLGFVLLTQKNHGVCKTLNRAIKEAAEGEYIAVLASDDFWHPDKLRLQVDALNANPGSEFCFSQAFEFQNENDLTKGRIFPKKCLSGYVLDSVFIRQHVPAGTMLFSRKLYDYLDGFDESLQEEDWDFVIRCAANTTFSSVDAPLLYYRSHLSNTMKTRSRHKVFHQKAKVLAKNFDLVSHWRWFFTILLHFSHDILLRK
jgi:alpha-1,3-rhamnosyltransferase